MAGLQGQTVQSTYDGLLKTIDNQPLNGTLKALTDGDGNVMPIEASTSGVAFTADVDFTNATITGLSSGTSGTSGVNGTAGTSGTSGTSGLSGSAGTSGTSGVSGDAGTSGTSGTSGVNGTSGTSGVNGDAGTSGTSGINGDAGSSGTSGTSGVSGAEGTSGTSGTSGINGEAGSSGTSGTSGGGSSQEMFPVQFLNVFGFPPAFGNYFTLSSPVVGRPIFGNNVNTSDTRGVMGPLYMEPGLTIPYIWFLILDITGNDNYEFAIYDTYSNGRPKDRIYYSAFLVDVANGANQWVFKGADSINFTESFYWIALKPTTGAGTNSKIGAVSSDNMVGRLYNTSYSTTGLYPTAELLFDEVSLPTSFEETYTFGHSDQGFVVGLSLGPE